METWDEVQGLTDEQIIQKFNSAAPNTSVGLGFWREELFRRTTEREAVRVRRLTAFIFWITVANLIAAAVAAAAAIASLS